MSQRTSLDPTHAIVETSKARGSLATALSHAHRLLMRRPDLAAMQAHEILRVAPGQPDAMLLLGRAEAAAGDLASAITTVRRLSNSASQDPRVWQLLANLLRESGDPCGADQAHLRSVDTSPNNPRLMQAALALRENRLDEAEVSLKDWLDTEPSDVAAIRMLAEVEARLGQFDVSAALLERCLALSPSFHEARHAYAQVLQRQERPLDALAEAERLLSHDRLDPGYRLLKASILTKLGDQQGAILIYESLLTAGASNQPKVWMSYGHTLKTVGRTDAGVAAYRKAVKLAPHLGEAWWSLANLKLFRFEVEDIAEMRRQLAQERLSEEDRLHLHFALGRALEDLEDFEAAFEAYRQGNSCRAAQLGYSAEHTMQQCRRSRALFNEQFFSDRAGLGSPARDPIFIVGLPRSGSTLIEQILSSHTAIEGTMELPDLVSIAHGLSERGGAPQPGLYPEVLASLDGAQLAALGQEYLDRTRPRRHTARPFFIDKLPNNWMHVGLIQLILPNATIIDARRHPLGCCFSAFKQHFARGQGFTYDLSDVGHYYREYVGLMAHIDGVLPGRVHRVIYEQLVADTEAEVRRLLDGIGLPFEPGCLKFWSNPRAVRTASSEQVRRPIFADGVDHWRHFEPWLDPLKAALGPVLQAYPAIPPEAV